MSYRLVYSQTSRNQIRSLHPQIKTIVKRKIREIDVDPFFGKALEKDLSGYHSIRAKRFRIIYRIIERENIIQIHYVGHRRDIYEIFRETIEKIDGLS